MRIGIDLGGTKIEAIALIGGREVLRRRVATPRGNYEATVSTVSSLVKEIGAGTVGIGIPGALSRVTGFVKNANSTWLIGRPLKQDLEQAIGREVRLENDANCFALSEAADGAAAGCSCVFGVILGTGVGGGIAVDGRVLGGANAIRGRIVVGANAMAGEWGHTPLPALRPDELPGPACYCGRRGCIETFLSGPVWLPRRGGLLRDVLVGAGARRPPPPLHRPGSDRAPDRRRRRCRGSG